MMRQSKWLAGLTMLFLSAMLHGQTVVRGTVHDRKSGKPLAGCNVAVMGTVRGAATGSSGEFSIGGLKPGRYTLQASRIGYDNARVEVSVKAGANDLIEIKLDESAVLGPAVVVTASKRQQPLETTPISVDVLSSRDIGLRNVISVDEVLTNATGIGVIDGQIDIRGSTGFNWTAGSRVLLLMDGHPLIGGDTGGINWDAIAPEEIDHVEVVKGAGSSLYGSNAMAGVINIITKSPSETPITRWKTTWGCYDEPVYDEWIWTDNFITQQLKDGNLNLGNVLSTRGVALSHSRQLGPTGLRLNVSHRHSTGYQQNGDYDRWNIMGKTRTKLAPGQILNISGGWSVNDHGDLLQWESQERALEVPADELDNSVRYEKFYTNADYRYALSDRMGLTAKAHAYCTSFKNDFHDNSDEARNWRMGTEIQTDYIAGRHSITTGFETVMARTNSDIYGDRQTTDLSLYGQDQWELAKGWHLTAGLRFDHHSIDVDSMGTDWQISPRVGLVGAALPGGLWRFSAGRGFRAPSIAEVAAQITVSGYHVVPNYNLKDAERAWSLETGWHQVFGWPRWPLSPMFDADAAFFYTHYDNMIDVVADNASGGVQFANVGRARVWGLECRLNGALLNRRIEWQAGYTWLNHEFTDTGEPLPYRPRHRLTTSVSGRHKGWFAGVDYRYGSRMEAVAIFYPLDPRVPMHVMDARLGHQWKRLRLTFEVKNLRNYHYTLRQRFLEPVREFYVTLEGVLGEKASL